mmetsp:Transcript_16604/g.40390  ORF Transcript_16604/g.40390 Transcript_16604/m.40390 type:complete len:198 (+) Transcript_16604:52-645(+)
MAPFHRDPANDTNSIILRHVPNGDEIMDKTSSSSSIGRGPQRRDGRSSLPKAQLLFEKYAPKFVLEVLGSSGAVWGSAEVLGFRNDETQGFWRHCAIMIGIIFFVRWTRQIYDEDISSANATAVKTETAIEQHDRDFDGDCESITDLPTPKETWWPETDTKAKKETTLSPIRPSRLLQLDTSYSSPTGAEMTTLISK